MTTSAPPWGEIGRAANSDAVPVEYSDDALAQAFTERSGDDLRYTAVWGRWVHLERPHMENRRHAEDVGSGPWNLPGSKRSLQRRKTGSACGVCTGPTDVAGLWGRALSPR
jgi:hypothetical protein